MGLFGLGITEQQQASKAATKGYPQFGNIARFFTFHEHFNREALNLTDAAELYTSAVSGTGAVTMGNANRLVHTTGTTINSTATVRTSGLGMARTARAIDDRSRIIIDIVFTISSGTASVEYFIGLLLSNSALTTVPGSNVRKIGLEVDTAVDGDFHLNSANASDEEDTDTGVTADTTTRLLRIDITGDNAATVTLFPGVDDTAAADGTHTATSLGATSGNVFLLHTLAKTLDTASKVLDINEYSIDVR